VAGKLKNDLSSGVLIKNRVQKVKVGRGHKGTRTIRLGVRDSGRSKEVLTSAKATGSSTAGSRQEDRSDPCQV